MENQDLSRMMAKDSIYFDIRLKCSELSKKLKKRITIRNFLAVAASELLKCPNLDKKFKTAKEEKK